MTCARGCALDVRPERPEPSFHFFSCQHRERLLQSGNRPVAARFAEKQKMLDLVSDDCSRLEGLPVETGAVALSLVNAISNFVPQDWSEAVQSHFSGSHLNVRAERHHIVATTFLTRDADIANYATDSPTRYQNPQALAPDFIELI